MDAGRGAHVIFGAIQDAGQNRYGSPGKPCFKPRFLASSMDAGGGAPVIFGAIQDWGENRLERKDFSVHRPERRANAFKWHPAGWGERRHPRPDERCLINECFRLGIYFVADGNPCQETDGRSCPDIPFLQRLHLAPSGKIPLRNPPCCSERLSTSMRTALNCLGDPSCCSER